MEGIQTLTLGSSEFGGSFPSVTSVAPVEKATTSLPYVQSSVRIIEGYGLHGAKPRPFAYEQAIRQFNHWAYAAAMLNANAVASVPRRLYVRKRKGRKLYETRPVGKFAQRYLQGGYSASQPCQSVVRKAVEFGGDYEEVVEPHPALGVLQRVNPWENGFDHTSLLVIDLQITGNAYEHIVTGPLGVPREIWRMPAQWVQIKPSRTQVIESYIYGALIGIAKPFAPHEVIHHKIPNPVDIGWYGKGWFEAAWTALGLHQAKREMDAAFHENMARPDWLLSVAGASTDVLDRLEGKAKEKLQGTSNHGQFLTVNAEVKATPLQFQVTEVGTPKSVIEEIAACSGVPVAMLLSNDPNRASSEVAKLGWYRNTIRPYCIRIEEKYNEKWLPLFDGSDDYFIAHDPVSFEDRAELVKEQVGLVAGGILKPNEARMELGYQEVSDKEADQLYPPSGSTGGAAAVAGDNGVNQNNRRTNEDKV